MPLKDLLDAMELQEQTKKEVYEKPKKNRKPVPNIPFSEMTLDQLQSYEFPRNIFAEYTSQAIEKSPLTFVSCFIIIGIPFFIKNVVCEFYNKKCKSCKQQLSRHLHGWDGGQLACGNPLCIEKSDMMTIRSIKQQSLQYKNKEFLQAYNQSYKLGYNKANL